MAKAKVKKGAKMICVPCGRQIVVSNCGISTTTLWCCGRPMRRKTASLVKKVKARLTKKKKR